MLNTRNSAMHNFTIEEWDENKFRDSRAEWTHLLERSNSDQLFMSWEWQYTWWKTFSTADGMALKLIAVKDQQGNLAGIAPLYISNAVSKKCIKTKRLQFIGNCWRAKPTMPTELLDFIVEKKAASEIIKAVFSYLSSMNQWNELVLVNLNTNSRTYKILSTQNPLPTCYMRTAEKYKSYYLETKTTFPEYLKELGKNTRLRLFNRRKILEGLGEVTFESPSENIDDQFKLLNQLHSKRWGSPVFSGERLSFNAEVAALMAENNNLRFSTLSIDGKPFSIQYNYVINGHQYNIQAGFDEQLHKKLAPGYLHFGYEIETAFANATHTYDFLAGEGKNTQYKERLTGTNMDIVDMQIIRSPGPKLLYRLYDYWQSKN